MAQKFQESSSNACEIESWLSYYTNALRALHAMRFHCSFNFLHSSSSILKVPNSYICTATRTSLLHTCLADTLGGALSAHPRCVPQWSTAEPAQASRGVHTEVLEAKDRASRPPSSPANQQTLLQCRAWHRPVASLLGTAQRAPALLLPPPGQ